MDLKDFVSDSIFQICAGINDAQEKTKELGAIVSPRCSYLSNGIANLTRDDLNVQTASIIHFDVALTVSETDDKKKDGDKGIRLQIAEIAKIEAQVSTGGKKETRQETSSISRLQFDIPVIWPMLSGDNKARAPVESPLHTRAVQEDPFKSW